MAEYTIPHPETQDERRARLDLERRALASTAPGSLPQNLSRLLALGLYTNRTPGNEIRHESAIPRSAAALTKAVSVALSNGEPTDDAMAHVSDVEFDAEDAVVCLNAISTFLEVAPDLLGALDTGQRLGEREASNG